MHAFEDHVLRQVVGAMESLSSTHAADTYVVSLLVGRDSDDPRCPTLLVGTNTESRCVECAPIAGEGPGYPKASSAREASWNYAYFLQDCLAWIGEADGDPVGVQLRREWIEEELDAWYSDAEEEADLDVVHERARRIQTEFWELAVRVVHRLHGEGLIERTFGRSIPVLLHELEYDEQTLELNLRANPPPTVADLEAYFAEMHAGVRPSQSYAPGRLTEDQLAAVERCLHAVADGDEQLLTKMDSRQMIASWEAAASALAPPPGDPASWSIYKATSADDRSTTSLKLQMWLKEHAPSLVWLTIQLARLTDGSWEPTITGIEANWRPQ